MGVTKEVTLSQRVTEVPGTPMGQEFSDLEIVVDDSMGRNKDKQNKNKNWSHLKAEKVVDNKIKGLRYRAETGVTPMKAGLCDRDSEQAGLGCKECAE